MSTLCGKQVCIAFLREYTETMERPQNVLYFYMYFYTAAVGEGRRKEYLSKEEGRIGSNTMTKETRSTRGY